MRHALMLALTLASLGASASEPWTAPYSLEAQHGRTFRVVLGEKAPKDVKSRLGVMTLVGKKGLATARLQKVEPVCVKLCEDRVCHAVGVYKQEPGTGDVGEGLAALPGRIEGKMLAPAAISPEPAPTARQWTSKEYQTPVVERQPASTDNPPPQSFRWMPRAQGAAVLEEREFGADFYAPPIELAQCRQEQQSPFTRLVCPSASLLYAKQQLLITSVDDYGKPSTEWVATLQSGGQELYLVRVGLKGQVVTGLLFQEGGRWRLLVRPADYPLLC
ncbi:hypothetical protein JY651_37570 [Pyxidicoccus parkwayensis]|uniref:Lipoprotein n=1 Tax=Pyxidicoccus parkwayensis TaxID=2813578 RepID=A0ABX7NPW2_9BACT|nr:hypothetical protein [Pyxidicoccus parkwaysis]QSQ20891.1 hypothetical protein JY651_37570 [Pyxidicoccus parkwaysis]